MTAVVENVTEGVKSNKAACKYSWGLLWTVPLFVLKVKLW